VKLLISKKSAKQMPRLAANRISTSCNLDRAGYKNPNASVKILSGSCATGLYLLHRGEVSTVRFIQTSMELEQCANLEQPVPVLYPTDGTHSSWRPPELLINPNARLLFITCFTITARTVSLNGTTLHEAASYKLEVWA
jgi:hypothetical protein